MKIWNGKSLSLSSYKVDIWTDTDNYNAAEKNSKTVIVHQQDT